MKKLLRSLLAVMLVAMMAIAFTSCAKPDKVKDKLKDMDYEVELVDDEDELEEFAEMMDVDGITAIIEAWSEEDEDAGYVTIIWFEKKADAEDALDAIEDLAKLSDMDVASKGKIVVVGEGDVFDDACDIVKAK